MLCRGVKEPGSSPARKESKQKEEKVAAVDKGAAEKEKVAKERSRSKSGEEDICFSTFVPFVMVNIRRRPQAECDSAPDQDPHRAADAEREQGTSAGDLRHLRQDQRHRVRQREDAAMAQQR